MNGPGEEVTRDAYPIMEVASGLDMPAGFRRDFTRIVERHAEMTKGAVTAERVRAIFDREYMVRTSAPRLLLRAADGRGVAWFARASFRLRRWALIRRPMSDSAVLCVDNLRTLGVDVTILDLYRGWIRENGRFVTYIQCLAGTQAWGAGISRDAASAARKAVLVAVIRAQHTTELGFRHESEIASGQDPAGEDPSAFRGAIPQ